MHRAIMKLGLGGTRRSRVTVLFALACCVFLAFQTAWLYRAWPRHGVPAVLRPPRPLPRPADGSAFNPSIPINPCRGPRGKLLDDRNTQDLARGVTDLPGFDYPDPTTGSFAVLGLEPIWMSFDQRYGPYGWGEELSNYTFGRVDWNNDVNWGELQRECALRNKDRLGPVPVDDLTPRFRLPNETARLTPPRSKTGRQAIVLRCWSDFRYSPEDMYNIRSIIAEAALASGGEYQVILLVDVKDAKRGPFIHKNDNIYREVLVDSVPPEFHEIAVLFHVSLQEAHYPLVGEFSSFWQIMQPLQLTAHFFPEFDHFWQIEMDSRFTGDAGKILRAFSDFGKNTPYKQSRERASWSYMPQFHGSYQNFTEAVNTALKGGANIWGPTKDTPIEPIKEKPPMRPKLDRFEYGVGDDADLLLFSPLQEISRFQTHGDWQWMDWIGGFNGDTTRFMSMPAQARASWDLLEAIHDDQHETGIHLHGEATLPTFAFWNGLKVVGLPMPYFQRPIRDPRELYNVLNGPYPQHSGDGIADGSGRYRGSAVGFFMKQNTWDWWGTLPNNVYEYWMQSGKSTRGSTLFGGENDPMRWNIEDELPWFMAEYNGTTYAPGFFMHPRKT